MRNQRKKHEDCLLKDKHGKTGFISYKELCSIARGRIYKGHPTSKIIDELPLGVMSVAAIKANITRNN